MVIHAPDDSIYTMQIHYFGKSCGIQTQGSTDQIAESDSTCIFMQHCVIILFKQPACYSCQIIPCIA